MSDRRRVLIAAGAVLLAAIILYQMPAVRSRIDWRVDRLTTYVRGILIPAGPFPTPLPVTPIATGTAAPPTITPTPAPTDVPPTPTPTALPASVTLTKPGYEAQGENNCGAAALTMYLRFYGWQGGQYDISNVIKPIPADRNVTPAEMAYYVGNYAGWLRAEFRVGGDLDVLRRLIAAGYPVMIEETFIFKAPYYPNDDLWAAHYLLLTGYDDASRTFVVQDSYEGPNQQVGYDQILERWESFNYLYFLLFPPAGEADLQALVGADWDADANRQNALARSQAATTANPGDAFAWFNLGTNLVYFERYDEAAQAYDRAREIGLPQRMLRYQFGPFVAYFRSGRIEDLSALTQYALQRTANSEEALLWDGWARYQQGDASGAAADWQAALAARPGYSDAQYALGYLNGQP